MVSEKVLVSTLEEFKCFCKGQGVVQVVRMRDRLPFVQIVKNGLTAEISPRLYVKLPLKDWKPVQTGVSGVAYIVGGL